MGDTLVAESTPAPPPDMGDTLPSLAVATPAMPEAPPGEVDILPGVKLCAL